MGRGAFFLDRDGTINVDFAYIAEPDLIELIPGSAEAIVRARNAGFLVVVITNQSGIGRGLIQPEAMPRIHARLDELLRPVGAKIDDYRFCVHAPEMNCDCRKPRTKLVEDAVAALGIDLSRSVFVGDRLSDVATGKSAGCAYSLLVRTGKGVQEEESLRLSPPPPETEVPDQVVDDLSAAVDWSLARLRA
jgi:D-glycero-D-manno-heptose 1,7-bisphosphate phosphatase